MGDPPVKKIAVVTAINVAAWLAIVAGLDQFGWSETAQAIKLLGLGVAAVAAMAAIQWARRQPQNVLQSLVFTASYVALWQALVTFTDALEWYSLRTSLAQAGLGGLFLIGLAWVVWAVERVSQRHEAERVTQQPSDAAVHRGHVPVSARSGRLWNPLDPEAWYDGRRSPRLMQSLTALGAYSFAFLLVCMILSTLRGCKDSYEMPAGGGKPATLAQVMKIQKVIKKKFVINPFSSIIFNPPPIDDVKLQLQEVTQHAYTVGYGEGEGAGFAGGTSRGKVRFIRLEYPGGDWNQDFGVGADLNMLVQYGVRTGQKINDRTESRTVSQLASFPPDKSPPVVYLTGQRNITLSKREIEILKAYLIDKHGLLFGDNGGSNHFHNQFFAMMRQVLPAVEPVRVPLDDVIHRVPYPLPFLPYVAPHGGKDAWGWRIDGRWVCYYHPGDIGDAWTDDHSGVRPEIYEACYQLGTNVIFYGHVEYSRWLEAQKKSN